MNIAILTGRLTKEPELKYLPNGGTAVCRFSIAVDKELSREKKQEMESQGKYTADFINIVAWGKQGENVANYMRKGSQVAIQGRIQTGSYNANDGSKRYTFDVVAEKVEFLGGGNNDRNNSANTSSNQDFSGSGFDSVEDEDIPF